MKRMKRLVAMLLLVGMLCSFAVPVSFAEANIGEESEKAVVSTEPIYNTGATETTESEDNLTWKLDEYGTLTISGSGSMGYWDSPYSVPWYGYRRNIKSVIIEAGITSIGGYAFSSCDSLTSITIPDSVTTIGDDAFDNCSSLTSITIPDSVTTIGDYAFYYCTSLTSITIPDSVTSIGNYMFSWCTNLTSVTLPDSVTSIGNYMFSWCTNLTSVTIPDSVTTIGDDAFFRCTSLTSITIPDSVTSIGNYAFSCCTSLTGIWVDENNSVYSSDSYGVLYDKDKTTVLQAPGGIAGAYTIPDSVTIIGVSAFESCTSLTSVTLPDSVTSIGGYAFNCCTSLTSVTIGNSVTSIGKYAFANCTSLTENTIPDNVNSIGDFAFASCTGLKNVAIGNGVTSIVYGAFASCSSLTELEIPESVTTIDLYAFEGCKNMQSITIPRSVRTIGPCAFEACTGLTDVYYGGTETLWSEITVRPYNEYLTNATIHFVFCEHTTVENGVCAECGEKFSATIIDSEGNVIGSFTSFADAMDVVAESETLSLQTDCTANDMILPSGVTLDLNGHTMTVDSALTYSSSAIVDSSADASGLLKINDTDGNMISENNSQLPVYDPQKGGYRFFAIDVSPCTVTGKNNSVPKYWFKIRAEKFAPLYQLIQADAELFIKVKMTWDGQTEDTYAVADLAFTKAWADRYNADEDVYVTVTVAEAEGLENFALIPFVSTKGITEESEKKLDYTVNVLTPTGEPVSNAIVVLNGKAAYTDSQGSAVFQLPADSYSALIFGVPSEYVLLEDAYQLTGDAPEVTVNLGYAPGHQTNPIVIRDQAQIKVEDLATGEARYYSVYDVGGTTLEMEMTNGYILVNGTKYEPQEVSEEVDDDIITKSVITVDLEESNEPVSLAVVSTDTSTQNVTVNFAFPTGSKYNPEQIKSRGSTAYLSSNVESYSFFYSPVSGASDGTFTVTVTRSSGTDYDIIVTNGDQTARLSESASSNKVILEFVGNKRILIQVVATQPLTEELSVTVKPTVTIRTGATYTVTLVNPEGDPLPGVQLQFMQGGEAVGGVHTTDSNGVVQTALPKGQYSVKLLDESYDYDEAKAVVTSTATSVTIEANQTEVPVPEGMTRYKIMVTDFSEGLVGAYLLLFMKDGEPVTYHVADSSSRMNTIDLETGTYEVRLAFFGETVYYYEQSATMVTEQSPNLTVNIGTAPEAGTEEKVYKTYIPKVTPVAQLLPDGLDFTFVDIKKPTGTYNLVYNPTDGYYHMNSADGPVVYIQLTYTADGTSAPYITLYEMVGGVSNAGTYLRCSYTDPAGNEICEDYTDCMLSYGACADPTYGVYPLTDDLIYMIQMGGQYQGWWDADNPNSQNLFAGGENLEIAWMFALCYVD